MLFGVPLLLNDVLRKEILITKIGSVEMGGDLILASAALRPNEVTELLQFAGENGSVDIYHAEHTKFENPFIPRLLLVAYNPESDKTKAVRIMRGVFDFYWDQMQAFVEACQ